MKTLAITLLLLCLSPNLWADGFGGTHEIAYETTIEDRIWADISSPASSGTLDSMRAYLTVTTATHNVKCALYLASDTSFVDSTEIIAVGVSEGWVYFDFVGNGSITASTDYMLCVVANAADGDCKIEFNISGGTHIGQETFTYGVWLTPKWTTADQGGIYDFSIYAYYTASAAATGQVIIIQH